MFALSSITGLYGMSLLTYYYHLGDSDTAELGVQAVRTVLALFVAGLFGLMAEAFGVAEFWIKSLGFIPLLVSLYLLFVTLRRHRANRAR
jgi:hypothetical protein